MFPIFFSTGAGPGFFEGWTTGHHTGPVFFGGESTGHPTGPGFFEGGPTGHRTGPGFETGFLLFKKSWHNCPNFFFSNGFRRATGKGMVKEQVSSVTSEEVFQVENKCPFLPIYPTYDQYVQ